MTRRLLGTLGLVVLPACGSENPVGPAVGRPVLIAPLGVEVAQNRPDIGCDLHPFAGYGLQVVFQWQPVVARAGIESYEIEVKSVNAQNALISTSLTSQSGRYTYLSCHSYVADPNLQGWEWRVRAKDRAGLYGDWSETGTFAFAPCRIDGRRCVSPG